MFEITSVTSARIAQAFAAGAGQTQRTRRPATPDRVEFSDVARSISHADMRSAARLSDLRARIAAGKYLTNDKLDYVAERLHSELRGARTYVA